MSEYVKLFEDENTFFILSGLARILRSRPWLRRRACQVNICIFSEKRKSRRVLRLPDCTKDRRNSLLVEPLKLSHTGGFYFLWLKAKPAEHSTYLGSIHFLTLLRKNQKLTKPTAFRIFDLTPHTRIRYGRSPRVSFATA